MKKIVFIFLLSSSLCFAKFEKQFGISISESEKGTTYEKDYTDSQETTFFRTLDFKKEENAKNEFEGLLDFFLSEETNGNLIDINRFPDSDYVIIEIEKNTITLIYRTKKNIHFHFFMKGKKFEKDNNDFVNYLMLNNLISQEERSMMKSILGLEELYFEKE